MKLKLGMVVTDPWGHKGQIRSDPNRFWWIAFRPTSGNRKTRYYGMNLLTPLENKNESNTTKKSKNAIIKSRINAENDSSGC